MDTGAHLDIVICLFLGLSFSLKKSTCVGNTEDKISRTRELINESGTLHFFELFHLFIEIIL